MSKPIPYTLTSKAHNALGDTMTTTRITKANIEQHAYAVNERLTALNATYRVQRYSAYGMHTIHATYADNRNTGHKQLAPLMSTRECYQFIYGMLQGLEIMTEFEF